MSGHSHWAGIKRQKAVTDQKRGQLFSKLLNAIAIATRQEPNPEFNPRLRAAIEKAKNSKVSSDSIERAIKRGSAAGENLEELTIEAYGPAGTAILIEAITDNKNRAIAEIKKILSDGGAKWAESGSVRWAFEKSQTNEWQAKFLQAISEEDKNKLQNLIAALDNQDEVQKIYTNTK